MVFLSQNSRTCGGEALQAKLDKLIRALETAENRFTGVEQRSEREIGELRAKHEGENQR